MAGVVLACCTAVKIVDGTARMHKSTFKLRLNPDNTTNRIVL